MRIAFLGADAWGLYYVKKLIGPHEVCGIVTLRHSPGLATTARKNHIPTYEIKNRRDRGEVAFLRDFEPDLILTAGFGRILKRNVLDIPRLGAVNIHASYLPEYRGPEPLERQIINGEPEAGVTLHYMDEGIDSGDILAQARVKILDTDSIKTMVIKLSRCAGKLLVEVLRKIEQGQIEIIRQDPSRATYFELLTEEERKIDWAEPANTLHNLVRGLPPYNAAFAEVGRHRCFIVKARPIKESPSGAPGRIVQRPSVDAPLVVSTSDGDLEITGWNLVDESGAIVGLEESLRMLNLLDKLGVESRTSAKSSS